MKRIAVHRNLNHMATSPDKSIHMWSKKSCSGPGNSLLKLIGSSTLEGTIYLENPTAHYWVNGMKLILDEGKRKVATWITGTPTTTPIEGIRRRISINPLPPSRNGKAEMEYRYSDNREIVDFKAYKGIAFDVTGAYLIK